MNPPNKKRSVDAAQLQEASPWTAHIAETKGVVLYCEVLPADLSPLLALEPVTTAFEERPIAVIKIRGINLRVWAIEDSSVSLSGSDADSDTGSTDREASTPRQTQVMDLD